MDDSLISFIQRPLHTNAKYPLIFVAKFISALTSIEIGYSLPLFLLLLEHYDAAAILATYSCVILALVCRIPKRFIWRPRPSSDNRAVIVDENLESSSFPSSSVAACVVYGSIVGLFYEMSRRNSVGTDLPLGPLNAVSWLLILGCAVMTGWARIYLGTEYPSCCGCGAILGLFVFILGLVTARLHFYGCKCNEHPNIVVVHEIPKNELTSLAGVVIAFGVPLAILLVIALGCEPLALWKKSTHAFALLLPSLIFCIGFICPRVTGTYRRVSVHAGPPSTATVTDATMLTVLFSALGWAIQRKHILSGSMELQYAAFLFIFSLALISLVGTRMAQREEDLKIQGVVDDTY
jgi:protein-S-isoprenylcysteine O-methyltransferase Ste14